MDDTTLCKEVAEKVMGWTWGVREGKHGPVEGFLGEGHMIRELALSWNDAGRVIEKMREWGWKFSLACESAGFWRAIFWPSGEAFLSIEDTMTGDTMPRAVFLAALEALVRL